MSSQHSSDDVERIARAFHEHYEALAPLYGYQTRKKSAVPWEKVPHANANLMRATVDSLLKHGVFALTGTEQPGASGQKDASS